MQRKKKLIGTIAVVLLLLSFCGSAAAIPGNVGGGCAHFNDPVPSNGERDVAIGPKGVQTCINVTVDAGCTVNVTFQWLDESAYQAAWLDWFLDWPYGGPMPQWTDDEFWFNYSSWTGLQASQQLCEYNENVTCAVNGSWPWRDWRVVASFVCAGPTYYNETCYYWFMAEDCPLFYIYPPWNATNVCPCCDAMCVGINNLYGHPMNLTIYRSSGIVDVYGYNTSWCGVTISNYSNSITINHDLIDSDLVGFPVLVNLSNSIVSMADGGNSLRFYDSSCNLLPHEIDYWDNSSYGLVWVNVTSISSSVDTVFYVYYNDTSAASVENPTAVWDSNFVMVQHMTDNTTSDILDSTSYDNDGNKKGANEPIENISSKINSGQDFDGTDDYVKCLHNSGIDITTTDFSLEVWVKFNNAGSNEEIINKRHQVAGATYVGYMLRKTDANRLQAVIDDTDYGFFTGDTAITDTNWHHIVFLMDRDVEGNCLIYLDGVAETMTNTFQSTFVATQGSLSTTEDLYLGYNHMPAPNDNWLDGIIDEVRISNIARNSSWINASFDSQNQTPTFLSFGSQEHNWILIESQAITNEYIANIYTNITNGTYCFCIDGHINNSIYYPMRYNETYYWYVNVTDASTGEYDVSDTFQFTTARNLSDCPCGLEDIISACNDTNTIRDDAWLVGLIIVFSVIPIYAIKKRRN